MNSIPYSHFLGLRHLCSDDSDSSLKSVAILLLLFKRAIMGVGVAVAAAAGVVVVVAHKNLPGRDSSMTFFSVDHARKRNKQFC